VKRTCGCFLKIPTGNRRVVLAQILRGPKTGRSVDLAEVGALHHVVLELSFFCRPQTKEGR
jgi:hypothetical protein